jgi:hypothetical protein
MFVSSPEWRTLDASTYDSLTLTVNGPAAIAAASLPEIGLESSTNQRTTAVNLATVLRQGSTRIPAWQKIDIPQGLPAVWPVSARSSRTSGSAKERC